MQEGTFNSEDVVLPNPFEVMQSGPPLAKNDVGQGRNWQEIVF
jgi:hypothetical protein